MWVWMIKRNIRWKTALCVVALALFTVLCICSAILVKADGKHSMADVSVQDENAVSAYLCAIDASDATQLGCESIRIPDEFDDVYEEYNDLQQKSGRNLKDFRGKDAWKYTYVLSGKDTDYAVLLVKNGEIIGGHLTNGEYGGEYLPLL